MTPLEGSQGSLLGQVQEGMDVYDCDDHKVGTVKRVYMGGGNDPVDVQRQRREAGVADPADTAPTATVFGDLVDAFTAGGDHLPDELRQKLEREGFVEIDTAGLFAADRYATPDQIARVDEDRVVLSTSREGLLKE